MKTIPKCKLHGKPIQILCKDCSNLLCVACIEAHTTHGCKDIIDLPSYATREILPKYKSQIDNFDQRKDSIEIMMKNFLDSTDNILQGLLQLKEKYEYGIKNINDAIVKFSKYVAQPSPFCYGIKELLINDYMEVRNAVIKEDMWCIIQKLGDKYATNVIGLEESEKRLVDSVTDTLSYLVESKEFDSLMEYLDELKVTYDKFANQCGPRIVGKTIYGISQNTGYKKLCKYEILTRKFTPLIDVQEMCAVSQIGRHIFLSGGKNPLTNKVNEYLEESQTLAEKEPMKFPKCYHKIVPLTNVNFLTIGGYNDHTAISNCEEYLITSNIWQAVPSLNKPRYNCATVLMDNHLLYAIGGSNSSGTIEVLDTNAMNNWSLIKLNANEISFTASPAAIPLSEYEILVLNGNNCTKTGIFNIKESTVRKSTVVVGKDEYAFNPVCMIDSNAYIIGSKNGTIHIYIEENKGFYEIDYVTAIS